MNISNKELKNIQSTNIYGDLKQLQEIAKNNPIATSSVDRRLLGSDIPIYKQIKYSGDVRFQKELFSLPYDRYQLFLLLSNESEEVTKGWEKRDERLANNLLVNYHSELITDVTSSVNNGQELTPEEIRTLKKLLTQNFNYGDNNIFNITTREELANYDNVKQTICQMIINDPYLKNTAAYQQYDKYLSKFKFLEPIDRLKLALVESGFDMNMVEAVQIGEQYNNELLNINDKNKQAIINQMRVLHYIINSTNIDELQLLGQSENYYHLDFDQTIMLEDDIAQIVKEDIASNLYSPRQEDLMEQYEGTRIYKAPLDFETISKFASMLNKEVWDSSYSSVSFDGGEHFRINTSMSYTNGELLNPNYEALTFGLGKGIKKYGVSQICAKDAHSQMSSTPLYAGSDPCAIRIEAFNKENITNNTGEKYNELVVNTLSLNPEAESYDKMQPEYFIYYQKASDMTNEERNNDEYWKKTVEQAKEFGVPIVIVDCEAIRKNELLKVKAGIEKGEKNAHEKKRLMARIKHYKGRYGGEEIEQLLAESNLGTLDDYTKGLANTTKDATEEKETVETIIQSIEELKEYQLQLGNASIQEQKSNYTR